MSEYEEVIVRLDKANTIIEEIVRCEDCRWYKDFDGCFFSTAEVEPLDYCSHGIRKSEEESIREVARGFIELVDAMADRKTDNSSEKPNNCEPKTGEMMTEEEFDSMLARVLIGKDEPQPNADQHVQRIEYVGNDEKSRCWTCKHFERMHETPISSDGSYYTYVVCTAKECKYEPKDEPQTERSSE